MAAKDCIDAMIEAAPHLTREEATAIDDAIAAYRRRRQVAGATDIDADTINFARQMGRDAEAAAMIEKRNRALNILADERRKAFYDQGGLASNRVTAILVGDQRGYFGAADSVDAQANAIEGAWMGGLWHDLREGGLVQALRRRTAAMDRDIANELARITDPAFGRDTGNVDARRAAGIIHRYQEEARQKLNEAGAWIGQLPGWIVRQSHDAHRIMKAGREGWKDFVRPLLDDARLAEIGDVEGYLDALYSNLATGNHLRADQIGSATDPAFKGPGNLGKRLSQERTIIFRDADAWFSYNDRFGNGSILEAAAHGLTKAARSLALLRRFGTNPESAFNRDIERLTIAAKESGNLSEVGRLNDRAIRNRFDYLTGKNSIPGNPDLARWGAIGRALVNMTSLGGVVLSAITDVPLRAAVLRHNGIGLLESWGKAFEGFVNSPQKREIAELIGIGLDGVRGSVLSRYGATDNLPGMVAKTQDKFFRLGLITQWTDSMKEGVGFMLSRNLANNLATPFDALHPSLRLSLERYGIDASRWAALGQAQIRTVEGGNFLTPDAVRGLNLPADEKDALETALRTYFVDQVNEALTVPGARERAILLQGTAPGTPIGEAVRFITQFKSFPTAFVTKHLGRELLRGQGADARILSLGSLAKADGFGIAQLIVGTTIMGYLAMSAKDVAKGQVPRDPTDLATWTAAFTQGGGLGIYGDFLFGDYNRFGKGAFETLAGPGVGKAADLIRILSGLKEAAFSSEKEVTDMGPQAWRAFKGYIPNLFYTKLALDYLILNQVQEWVSPGSLARVEKRMEEDGRGAYIFRRPSQTVPRGGGGRIFEGVR